MTLIDEELHPDLLQPVMDATILVPLSGALRLLAEVMATDASFASRNRVAIQALAENLTPVECWLSRRAAEALAIGHFRSLAEREMA